ncbi:uncharacterized protein LOC144167385 [Haemaphysalis longicornis]
MADHGTTRRCPATSSRYGARDLEPSVVGNAPRRRRVDTVPRNRTPPAEKSPRRYRSPAELEAARTSRYSRCDVFKNHAYSVLIKALIVTWVLLLSGVVAIALDAWIPGLLLILLSIAFSIACWVVFLCTCSERSRDFLRHFGRFAASLKPNKKKSDARQAVSRPPAAVSPAGASDRPC